MRKWEYRFVEMPFNDPGRQMAANALGDEGWELVSAYAIDRTVHLIFKRPV